MKKGTLILLTVLILVLIFLLIIQLNKKSSSLPSNPIKQTGSSSTKVNSTPTPLKKTLKIAPVQAAQETVNLTQKVSLIFSEPISLSNLNYSISPNTPINFSLDKTQTVLTISPQQSWDFNTKYRITFVTPPENSTVTFKTVSYGGI